MAQAEITRLVMAAWEKAEAFRRHTASESDFIAALNELVKPDYISQFDEKCSEALHRLVLDSVKNMELPHDVLIRAAAFISVLRDGDARGQEQAVNLRSNHSRLQFLSFSVDLLLFPQARRAASAILTAIRRVVDALEASAGDAGVQGLADVVFRLVESAGSLAPADANTVGVVVAYSLAVLRKRVESGERWLLRWEVAVLRELVKQGGAHHSAGAVFEQAAPYVAPAVASTALADLTGALQGAGALPERTVAWILHVVQVLKRFADVSPYRSVLATAFFAAD